MKKLVALLGLVVVVLCGIISYQVLGNNDEEVMINEKSDYEIVYEYICNEYDTEFDKVVINEVFVQDGDEYATISVYDDSELQYFGDIKLSYARQITQE